MDEQMITDAQLIKVNKAKKRLKTCDTILEKLASSPLADMEHTIGLVIAQSSGNPPFKTYDVVSTKLSKEMYLEFPDLSSRLKEVAIEYIESIRAEQKEVIDKYIIG